MLKINFLICKRRPGYLHLHVLLWAMQGLVLRQLGRFRTIEALQILDMLHLHMINHSILFCQKNRWKGNILLKCEMKFWGEKREADQFPQFLGPSYLHLFLYK